ncbi:alpha/beta hydrolase [uncultured Enterovirga sp.]|uniref:alpha/beta hydrolase n=1 Tax=uncultured Enterovirga sp. TaxID=2026352 RepID=UPI0035CB0829
MRLLEARQRRDEAWVAARPVACSSGRLLRSRIVADPDPVFDLGPDPSDAAAWDAAPLPLSLSPLPSGGSLRSSGRWGRDLGLAGAAALVATVGLAACSGAFQNAAPVPIVATSEAPARVAAVVAPRILPAPAVAAEILVQETAATSAASPQPAAPPFLPSGEVMNALMQGGGPDATASFVAPPARPREFAAEPARIRTARLEDGGPASSLLRQPATRPAGGLRQNITRLVQFETAPFPYDGIVPGTQQPFLNTEQGEERGHRTGRGRVLLEQETFSDNRVLTHMPQGFDVDRPGVMVVFFHGHGAILKRDVQNRQQVPAQITASGANAVLVAPQFAVDASDSSAGRFWEQGGFARFLDESAKQLARLQGDPASAEKFAAMPVVIVAYSGGFVPAAYALQAGGAKERVRGVVLLDAIYGEHEKFASWAASTKNGFLVNASTNYTKAQSVGLERLLAARDVTVSTELKPSLSRGGATFLSTGGEHSHRDYVTQAWTAKPIADILSRLPEYRLRGGGDAVATLDSGSRRQRSAAAQ